MAPVEWLEAVKACEEPGAEIVALLEALHRYPDRLDEALEWVAQRLGADATEAMPFLEALHQAFPERLEILNELAFAALELKEFDRAERAIRQVRAIAPDDPDALNNLGLLREARGELGAAAEAFEEAMERDPAHPFACLNLARLRRAEGDLHGAIAALQVGLASQADSRDLRAHYSQALLESGQPRLAARELERLVRQDPSDPHAHGALGMVYRQQQSWDKAIASFQRSTELDPNLAAGWFYLAASHGDAGHLEAGIAAYHELIRRWPDDGEARNNLGYLLGQAGELAEATWELQQALRLLPDLLEAHLNLADVLRRRGDPEAAVQQLEEALVLDPDHAGLHYNLALILGEMGHVERALGHCRHCLSLNLGDPGAQALLRDLRARS